MPWGIAAAVAAPVVGSAVSSMMGPSTSGGGGGGGPNYYTPTGLGQADQYFQDLLSRQTQNFLNNDIMQYGLQSLYGGLDANRQYSPAYQAAANQAGQGYTDLGNLMRQQSGLNFGTQANLLGAGQDVYNLGRDPQNALYGRTLQQLQEQTGNTNSMYGLGSSAAGAGVANQALSNFNIDWQNQQLQRALQGLQGYTGAAQTAGGYGQLATGQAQSAPGYTLQGGQLPYQTAQNIAAVPGQLGSVYGQMTNANIYGPAQSIQGSIIPYLNYGAGAQATPYTQQMQGAGALGSMVSQGIQGLGSTAQNQGWLSGNLWGGSSPWGGQSNATTSPVTDFYSGSQPYMSLA